MERAQRGVKKVVIEAIPGPFHNEYLVYPADAPLRVEEQKAGENKLPTRNDALGVARDLLIAEDDRICSSTDLQQELAGALR